MKGSLVLRNTELPLDGVNRVLCCLPWHSGANRSIAGDSRSLYAHAAQPAAEIGTQSRERCSRTNYGWRIWYKCQPQAGLRGL